MRGFSGRNKRDPRDGSLQPMQGSPYRDIGQLQHGQDNNRGKRSHMRYHRRSGNRIRRGLQEAIEETAGTSSAEVRREERHTNCRTSGELLCRIRTDSKSGRTAVIPGDAECFQQ